MKGNARRGQWVEIVIVVLESRDRTARLPEDTRVVDLVARVKGFLLNAATLGEQVRIRTILGREVTGTLRAIEPAPQATFGRPAPELLEIGRELRSILDAGESIQ